MDAKKIQAKLDDYRKGLEQLQQQALMQQGAILALEQLLEAEQGSTAEGAEGAEAGEVEGGGVGG